MPIGSPSRVALGQFVGDDAEAAGPMAPAQRTQQSRVTGAQIVDAGHVGVGIEQGERRGFGQRVVVEAFERADHLETGEFAPATTAMKPSYRSR